MRSSFILKVFLTNIHEFDKLIVYAIQSVKTFVIFVLIQKKTMEVNGKIKWIDETKTYGSKRFS